MKNATAITTLLLFTVLPAIAQPAPPGKCNLLDNGVAQVGAVPKGPQAISTPLPKGIGNAVADVSFRIQSGGAVSDVKILCTTSDQVTNAVTNAVNDWKFAPMTSSGKSAFTNASYRISAGGAIPLSFITGSEIKKIES